MHKFTICHRFRGTYTKIPLKHSLHVLTKFCCKLPEDGDSAQTCRSQVVVSCAVLVGECIVGVVPGGTELKRQLRRGVGQAHALAIILTSIVLEFIRHKQWIMLRYKLNILSSILGILWSLH